ncbi:MAG: hypothetical protein WD269_01235 [Acidimicrobiia bacterium]
MTRKLLATFTAVVVALMVVGVAWAGADRGRNADLEVAAQVSASSEGTKASTSLSGSTRVTTREGSSTSVTTGVGYSSTSSTIDDDDDHEIDEADDHEIVVAIGGTFQVPGVGSVTVDIDDGRLVLGNVSAPGWSVEVEDREPDRIKIQFRNGEAEAEFEVELQHGVLQIEIESN